MRFKSFVVIGVLGAMSLAGWLSYKRSVGTSAKSTTPVVITQPTAAMPPAALKAGEGAPTARIDVFAKEGYTDLGVKGATSENPLVQVFVDTNGRPVRALRFDDNGRIIAETRFKEGQSFGIERTFATDGTLIQERQLRNGVILKEAKFD